MSTATRLHPHDCGYGDSGKPGIKRMKMPLLVVATLAGWTLFVHPTPASAADFHDGHFHISNYVQQGIRLPDFLQIMGEQVGRVALFGIPLQQKWDYFESGDRAPDYYLRSDASLYYYSFVDAMVAEAYQRLSPQDQRRFDPMITGFNPTDMYATEHIRRVLRLYPGVFSGIGEFSIHKEFVSSKTLGHTASLHNPALHKILKFAGEVGLVVILHCDINTVLPIKGERPVHFDVLKEIFRAHPQTTIIWAHTGLGRFVRPTADHLELLKELLQDPAYSHVHCDISWDEVAKYVVDSPQSIQAWATLLNAYPDRFVFGTDSVAPKDRDAYLKTYRDYQPLWEQLDEPASRKTGTGNYERIFDAANQKVRAWERQQRGVAPGSGSRQ